MGRRAMDKTIARARGAVVEAVARAYLLKSGLRDVAANANYRFGELDLVMLDDSGHGGTTLGRDREPGSGCWLRSSPTSKPSH